MTRHQKVDLARLKLKNIVSDIERLKKLYVDAERELLAAQGSYDIGEEVHLLRGGLGTIAGINCDGSYNVRTIDGRGLFTSMTRQDFERL